MIVKTNQSGPDMWSAWLPDNSAKATGDTQREAVKNLKDSITRRLLAEEQEFEAARKRYQFWKIRWDAMAGENA